MPLSSHSRLGPYEIISLIDAGGMGEIYRAHDRRLRREVAIKVLTSSYSRDPKRVERFEHEARTAGSLNHPNIITLFDVGIEEGSSYLVTELLIGCTLRNRLKEGRIPLRKVIDFSIQIAHGLCAAHEKGIIHRDLKPENLFVTKNGRVKILDFGISKLTRSEDPSDDLTKVPTITHQTEDGVVLGTILYMSPEQVGGKKLDLRSDIFSFGLILYEMVFGKHPFHGKSNIEVIHSILGVEPSGLLDANPSIPPALQRIIVHCLEKNPDSRFQTASDLAFALEALSVDSISTVGSVAKTASDTPARHLKSAAMIGAALLFIIFGIYIARTRLARTELSSDQVESFQKMKITRLTTTGKISDGAISPDGKYVAYVIEEGGKESLWIRQISVMNNVLLLPPDLVHYEGVTFSNDSGFLYYVLSPLDKPNGTIYQIPVLGGPVRKLVTDVFSPVAISPDNASLAFIGRSELMISDLDGHHVRAVASPGTGKSFGGSPAWSPDGKIIAVILKQAGIYEDALIGINIENQKGYPITSTKWFDIYRLNWLADGSGIVLNAKDQVSGYNNYQIWKVSYPEGKVSRVTNDLNEYRGLSLASNPNTLLTVRLEQTSGIWLIDDLNSSPKLITSSAGGLEGLWGVSWSADKKIVYTSIASGNEDLWAITPDQKDASQLSTNEMSKIAPSCCSDGKSLVFMSRGKGGTRVWRMGMDGSGLQLLTSEESAGVPVCSADSQSAIYVSGEDQTWNLRKIALKGGESIKLTDRPSLGPAVSPDGELIAYAFLNDQHQKMIGIIDSEGGPILKKFPLPPTVLIDIGVGLRWTSDGQAIAYASTVDGVSNLWIQPLDGSVAKKITNFDSQEIFSFDLSRTGDIAVTRGILNRDVVLIKNF